MLFRSNLTGKKYHVLSIWNEVKTKHSEKNKLNLGKTEGDGRNRNEDYIVPKENMSSVFPIAKYIVV